MPSRDDILSFLEGAQEKVGKREISRAFNIKGEQRLALKALLADMAADGQIAGNRKTLKQRGKIPTVAVLEIVDRDNEGELVAEPINWDADDGPRPRVLVLTPKGPRRDPDLALSTGDRLLARVTRLEGKDVFGYGHEAEPIKKLPRERMRLLGIFRSHARGGGTIDPVNRRDLKTWPVREGNTGDARDGDLVRFDITSPHRRGMPDARIAESLGNPARPAPGQPDRSACAWHSRRVSGSRVARGRKICRRYRWRAAPTCGRYHCSPSIPPTRAITMTPFTRRPIPIREILTVIS